MIIGISGKKQSGKNTVGKILQILLQDNTLSNEEIKNILNSENEKSSKYKLVAFADKLKQISSILLNCNVSCFESEKFKNSLLPSNISTNDKVKTYRQFLQYVGTDLFNQINPNFWINLLFNEIDDNCIITDVRFKKEINEIKKKNGIVLRVISNRHLEDNHISEHDLDDYTDFDYYVYNTDDIDYLIAQLQLIIGKLNI